jgi:hypothetical protein
MATEEYVSSWGPEPKGADYSPRWVAGTHGREGRWHVPALGDGDAAEFRSEASAKRAGKVAFEAAMRDFDAWHAKKELKTQPSPAQELVANLRAAKEKALSEGVTADEWDVSAEIRAHYFQPPKSGAELYEEWRRDQIGPMRPANPDRDSY